MYSKVKSVCAFLILVTVTDPTSGSVAKRDVCELWKNQKTSIRCTVHKQKYKDFCPADYQTYCVNGALVEESQDETDTEPPFASVEDEDTSKQPGFIYRDPDMSRSDEQDKSAEENEYVSDINKEFQDCCRANGVHPDCMPVCRYGEAKLTEVLCAKGVNCETYLKVATYCGTNAQDNSACCAQKTGKAICSVFCNGVGEYPSLNDMFSDQKRALQYAACIEELGKLNECSVEEHLRIRQWGVKQWKKEQFPRSIAKFVEDECAKDRRN